MKFPSRFLLIIAFVLGLFSYGCKTTQRSESTTQGGYPTPRPTAKKKCTLVPEEKMDSEFRNHNFNHGYSSSSGSPALPLAPDGSELDSNEGNDNSNNSTSTNTSFKSVPPRSESDDEDYETSDKIDQAICAYMIQFRQFTEMMSRLEAMKVCSPEVKAQLSSQIGELAVGLGKILIERNKQIASMSERQRLENEVAVLQLQTQLEHMKVACSASPDAAKKMEELKKINAEMLKQNQPENEDVPQP